MKNIDFKIHNITIAVSNVEAMVAFYRTVFKCKLKEKNLFGTTLYTGQLGEINIVLCPNEIAGVKAEQNRQQFDFLITDLDKLIVDAKSSGGSILGEINATDTSKTVTVIDPDGNTIVFVQKLIE